MLCLLLPGDLPNSGIKSRSPALWADSLPTEPQGKPKNTRVGCHSLLQGIFLTQGSNPGLLHQQADSLPTEPPGKSFYILPAMLWTTASLPGCPCVRLLGTVGAIEEPWEFRDLRRGMEGLRVTLWFSQEFSYLPRS